jgi:hypothetical protein
MIFRVSLAPKLLDSFAPFAWLVFSNLAGASYSISAVLLNATIILRSKSDHPKINVAMSSYHTVSLFGKAITNKKWGLDNDNKVLQAPVVPLG